MKRVINNIKEKIASEYQRKNISLLSLCIKNKAKYTTLVSYFKRKKIPLIRFSHRKYSFNEKYFDKINSSNKAYFLGFLYADGNIFKNVVSLKLSEKDVGILNLLNKKIKNKKPLYKIENITCLNKKGVRLVSRDAFSLNLYSKHFSKKCRNLGLIENKTLKIRWPDKIIEDKFLSHFLRGYFDGDGSFCFCKRSDCNSKSHRVEISCKNLFFVQGVSKFLLKNGIINKIVPSGTIYKLIIFKNEDKKKFIKLLYFQSKIFMRRKKNIANQILSKIKEWESKRTSIYKGVSFVPKNNKWVARKTINGKSIHLGTFSSERKAFMAIS